jgi:MFS family permease
MQTEVETSYRALFQVPGFARLMLGTVLGRLAGQMWEVLLILFVLQRYRSPALAGLTVLFSILPGLVLSPIAGSLLDRQGRVRLMIFDYTATAALTAAIAFLSIRHALPVPLLLLLVTLLSLSNILSTTGARSLFPLMVPRQLWDRSNGVDTSSYSVTSIIGPAVAGLLIARFGPEAALGAMAGIVALAAVSLVAVREPVERTQPSRSLMRDSWAGLEYVLKNRTLRGLAAAFFFTNLAVGPLVIGVPLIIIGRLHGGADTVGQFWAVFGGAGLIAGLAAGRLQTEGRERLLIAVTIAVQAPCMALIAFAGSVAQLFGIALLMGAANSLCLVAIFAIRQRRTDPGLFGRAFAVSMGLNMVGLPVGSALTGPLFERSIVLPLLLGAAISLVAIAVMMRMIPRQAEHSPLRAAAAGASRETDPPG